MARFLAEVQQDAMGGNAPGGGRLAAGVRLVGKGAAKDKGVSPLDYSIDTLKESRQEC